MSKQSMSEHAVAQHAHSVTSKKAASIPEGEGGVTAAVVKFNALPNAVWPPSQDQDLGVIGGL